MTAESFYIFIDKPAGLSSQQCLTKFKRKFGFKKIGHHGTLDPFATGLLLVGVNEATKFFQYIDDSQKTYEAEIFLGIKTDTLDRTGKTVAENPVPPLIREDVEKNLTQLLGDLEQEPPMYSAIKINGQKLYKLARQGQEVDRPKRQVHIHELIVLDWQNPILKIRATVSRGTYIRVLAEQIAELFETVGHLTTLRRTVLCGVSTERAYCIEEDDFQKHIIAIEKMLPGYLRCDLSEDQKRDLYFGKPIQWPNATSVEREKSCMGFYKGQFIGMLKFDGEKMKSLRLISTPSCLPCAGRENSIE